MNNIAYIIVLFSQGARFTLQTDNKPHVFFINKAKAYKTKNGAIKRAKKLADVYAIEKICVFKVELGERLISAQYNKWCEDKNRLMWEYKQID